MIVEFPPGASIGEAHSHEGEECHLVLQGKILAEQAEDSFIVEEGDSFSWNASSLRQAASTAVETAIVYISIYSDTELRDIL